MTFPRRSELPGLIVRDVVAHTGAVYRPQDRLHAAAAVARRRLRAGAATGNDLLDWYDSSHADLLTELRQREPGRARLHVVAT